MEGLALGLQAAVVGGGGLVVDHGQGPPQPEGLVQRPLAVQVHGELAASFLRTKQNIFSFSIINFSISQVPDYRVTHLVGENLKLT